MNPRHCILALALVALLAAIGRTAANQPNEKMNDSRHDMCYALGADRPHPVLGEEANAFDRFIGTWDCDYANFKEDERPNAAMARSSSAGFSTDARCRMFGRGWTKTTRKRRERLERRFDFSTARQENGALFGFCRKRGSSRHWPAEKRATGSCWNPRMTVRLCAGRLMIFARTRSSGAEKSYATRQKLEADRRI